VGKAYRTNLSGANEEKIMELAHDLYFRKVNKRFDLMHWWLPLKDIPKWEILCNKFTEIASKHLNINETGAYSDNSTLIPPALHQSPQKRRYTN